MEHAAPCPNCNSRALYRGPEISAGVHAAKLLPGLGSFFKSPRFVLVVCRDCGLTRFFVEPAAKARLRDAKKWRAM